MSSSIKIKKVCEQCSEIFYAQKTTTRYCSHRSNSRAYKESIRNKQIEKTEANTDELIRQQPIQTIKDKVFLSFAETGILLGITRQAVYKMVVCGHLKASKISSRLSFIKRSDIEAMLEVKPYSSMLPKQKSTITEFYTTAEVKEKYCVAESWIYIVGKQYSIPRTSIRGKTHWSKKHIDKHFAQKVSNPDITEWYTVQEIRDKFQITLAAIYWFAEASAWSLNSRAVLASKRV